ncbi:Transmembrane transcriptional regulator (anti-sigma factor RsiW) [Yoonia tamlensis]|uniref:Transmembrane transcriptional regulator (Anti-sigma factor RsiW) n=1 Tax=Yoonia tamlensis TaxID=390270 RepID=A0A1I6GU82_9RHOB|nr:anti-sigma factor [Yoonia tamlensis]SFR45659.1 Transmembrane transcriptional regulator (anti-sigma factor RsiW) [Yoonia tamlensis]
MSALNDKITADMLHAFVDGQLDDADMAIVEAYLNENPDALDDVTAWEQQNAAINALYPARDTPPSMPALPTEPANTNAPSGLSWAAIAASVMMLAVGLAGGWIARGNQTNPALIASLVQEAVQAHAVYSIDPHRPVEVAASDEETLIRWLSNRVGEPLQAPDLTTNGFTLVGGRLVSATEGPAAQFMYEDATGKRITLFAVKGATGQLASFNYNQTGDTGSFYWEDANLSYAIVGDVDREALNQLAISIYNQL